MRLLIKSNHNYIVKSENVLRGSSPQYCCSSPNNLYNCILLSRDEIAGHFFTPSENVRLLFAVGDSTAYFFIMKEAVTAFGRVYTRSKTQSTTIITIIGIFLLPNCVARRRRASSQPCLYGLTDGQRVGMKTKLINFR